MKQRDVEKISASEEERNTKSKKEIKRKNKKVIDNKCVKRKELTVF